MTDSLLRAQEINAELDRIVAYGPDEAIKWLRGAYCSHVRQEAEFRETIRELVEILLANVVRPLTVREAQLCRVCRVCRCRVGAPCQCHGGETGSFILNFGEEFAHERCLKGGAA